MKIKKSEIKAIIKEVLNEGRKPPTNWKKWREEVEEEWMDATYQDELPSDVDEKELKRIFNKKHKDWEVVIADVGGDAGIGGYYED